MFVLLVVGTVFLSIGLLKHFAATYQERTIREAFLRDDWQLVDHDFAFAPATESAKKPKTDRWRMMNVVRIADESPDSRSFHLAPIDGAPLVDFHAGQYLIVSLPDPDAAGRSVSRCYSLSDGPNASTYRITVKRVPGGKMSNLLHDTIRVGDTIRTQTPMGKFHIGDQSAQDEHGVDRPLNLIAAGIGITPMIAMLRQSQQNTPARPIRLFYQLRDAANAPFLAELCERTRPPADGGKTADTTGKLSLFVAYSQPRPGDMFRGAMQGRMDAANILRACGSPKGDFMICGPDAFMTTIAEGLIAGGAQPACVQYESFASPTKSPSNVTNAGSQTVAPETDPQHQVEVDFCATGCKTTFDLGDSSLLDVAERSGIAIDSACRTGQCGSCVIRLLKGNVRYDHPPEFDGLEPGEALACVAKPNGPVTVDA
jgi:uncharacterized protein